ncbi:MAG: hypothetical protein ACYT04_41300 [Nostoc sp.]
MSPNSAIAYLVGCVNEVTHRIFADVRCCTLRANTPYVYHGAIA